MKAIFFLPAHPSYWPNADYSQDEIDRAIADYTAMTGGAAFQSGDGPVAREYKFLREPGKQVTVLFDSEGSGRPLHEYEVEQYRKGAASELQGLVADITAKIEANRGNYPPALR